MLILFKNQETEIGKLYFKIFVNKMIKTIAENYPNIYSEYKSSQWKEWIETKINETVQFNFEMESHIEEYIEISLCYPRMEQLPKPYWIKELLVNDNRTVEERLNILIEQLEFNS